MTENRAKAGAAVVLDAKTGEILALVNMPTYNPNNRTNLAGSQLRNRVFTDTFEPGSTMKPFTAALALEEGKVRFDTPIQTAPGKLTIGPATISDAHAHGILTVAQVIQKSSNVGAGQAGAVHGRGRHVADVRLAGFRHAAEAGLPWRGRRPPAPGQDLEADRAGHDVLRARHFGHADSACACLYGMLRAKAIWCRCC